ncbi:MAG TPA: hypothetical protein VGA64_00845 [Candidatus Polarisedimenticolia bacterium]
MSRDAAPRRTAAWVCADCGRSIYLQIERPADGLGCPGCGRWQPLRIDAEALGSRTVSRCLQCGRDQLYTQKDFNRKLGLAVFIVAALLSVPTWGVSLLAATLIDFGLYYLIGSVTICYACNTQHRGFQPNPAHGPFDLHIAEAVDRLSRAV